MSRASTGNILRARIKSETIAALVAGVLRREHEKSGIALKSIQAASGASYETACKWHRARNAPNSASLLELAKRYPNILRIILELIGRNDVWNLCIQNSIPEKMLAEGAGAHTRRHIYYDRFVGINVLVSSQISHQFNQRQLWFLGKLQQGDRITTNDICSIWHVNHRTAQRDVAGLMAVSIIKFSGAKKNGTYVLR